MNALERWKCESIFEAKRDAEARDHADRAQVIHLKVARWYREQAARLGVSEEEIMRAIIHRGWGGHQIEAIGSTDTHLLERAPRCGEIAAAIERIRHAPVKPVSWQGANHGWPLSSGAMANAIEKAKRKAMREPTHACGS